MKFHSIRWNPAGTSTSRAWMGVLFLILSIGMVTGCQSKGRDLPLDKELAKASLTQALDEWKAGTPADSLKARTPSLVVVDDDWLANRKLKTFEIVNAEREDGSNLYVQVKLVLVDGSNQERERNVTYIVGTNPVITIFRD